jgi:segregation and condensation protein A
VEQTVARTGAPETDPADPPEQSGPEQTGPGQPAPAAEEDPNVFRVRLAEFEGPFDLLLSLIAKHKLDVTTLALSQVTDDFIAYIRAQGPDWDLDAASEFLLIAATLLDLKAARLLPAAEVEDEEDLALLEARGQRGAPPRP